MSSKVCMMVGLPGSGKSTYCRAQLSRNNRAIWLSSDEIRRELYGDSSIQDNPSAVFELMRKRLHEAIQNGAPEIYYDATNVSAKRRLAFCKDLRQKFGDKVLLCAYVFCAPIEDCIERAKNRVENPISDVVIYRMLFQWRTPYYWEGWDKIEIMNFGIVDPLLPQAQVQMYNFNQHNPHHSLTLQEHCSKAERIVFEMRNCYDTICRAAKWHDVGKVYTQTFDDKGVAHYYGHEGWGGYLTLSLGLLCSALISHHMDPLRGEKIINEMDDVFLERLNQIHEADLQAH